MSSAQRQPDVGTAVDARGGFTLVEMLVAMMLLMVGLVAIGGVFAQSARTGTDSYISTAAATQALDMSERMWLDLPNPISHEPEWRSKNEGSLPGWDGVVTVQDSSAGIYTITVSTSSFSHDYLVHVPVAQTEQ